MTGSADMVVTGNAVSNGQTITFTLTVTASTTVTFTQNNSLTLSPPPQTGIAAGLAYVQPFAASGGSGTGYDWCVLTDSGCVWEGAPLPGGFSLAEYTGYLLSPGDPIATPGAYPFTVQVKDSAGHTAQVDFTLTIGCAVAFTNQPKYGLQPVSGLQYGKQYMERQFIAPPDLSNPTSDQPLIDYAQACGFLHFNWQQIMTALPAVSNLVPVTPLFLPDNEYPASCNTVDPNNWISSGCHVAAGPAIDTGNAQDYPNLHDAPTGGYQNPNAPAGYDPYPFYYPTAEVQPHVAACTMPGHCPSFPYVLSPDGTTLSIIDDPRITGLPGDPPSVAPLPGHYVSFITSLVGVSAQSSSTSKLCAPDSIWFCTTLSQWEWNSTYNKTTDTGGVSQTESFVPVDPGGTGGVSITRINGIPTPVVIVSPSAPSIAPSDNLTVTVTVTPTSGNEVPVGSILLSSGTYQSLAVHVGGSATFHLTASNLLTGTNNFTALYTPDPVSATSFSQAWGTAAVTVGTSLPAPTVTVTPASTSIQSAQPLPVTVTVSGASASPTPTGTVTLSGGGYTLPVVALVAGAAAITIPANSLSPGSDVLTVQYSPDAGSASSYSSATGNSAPVNVALSPAAAMPTFSRAGGSYSSGQNVVISTATPGATIYYTADGTTPSINSQVASGAIAVSGSETLKAMAAGNGYSPSPVASATYSIGSSAVVSILASFDGNLGAEPFAITPAQGTDGNFYGTTFLGGAHAGGTVFKVTPAGALSTVYSFCLQAGCSDGAGPIAGLTLSSNGLFYGTVSYGGPNSCQEETQTVRCGTIFTIEPDGTFNSLYSFKGADGAGPSEGVVEGPDGNLYGSTFFGGSANSGTIFKMTPGGSLTTLYTFCTQANCPDGYAPEPLMMGSDGNLYGSTLGGGTDDTGTLFKITPGGTLTTLYHFCSQPACSDGHGVYSALIQGMDGNFYGTAALGGNGNSPPCDNGGGTGLGTVFKLTPDGTYTVLHSFNNSDGATPDAGLTQGTDGNLYGTTACGGANGAGTIFSITPDGNLTTLYSLAGPAQGGAGTQGGRAASHQRDVLHHHPYGRSDGAGRCTRRLSWNGSICEDSAHSWIGGVDRVDPRQSLDRSDGGRLQRRRGPVHRGVRHGDPDERSRRRNQRARARDCALRKTQQLSPIRRVRRGNTSAGGCAGIQSVGRHVHRIGQRDDQRHYAELNHLLHHGRHDAHNGIFAIHSADRSLDIDHAEGDRGCQRLFDERREQRLLHHQSSPGFHRQRHKRDGDRGSHLREYFHDHHYSDRRVYGNGDAECGSGVLSRQCRESTHVEFRRQQ